MVVLTATGKENLDNLVAKVVEEQKISGFVFGASSIAGDIYFKGGGYNVVNNPASGEVGEDSVFWICSQTKMIVHIAALKLIEQGRISYEDPVSNYLPEFEKLVVVNDQMAEDLTYKSARTVMRLKHLFNFTSGLFYPIKGMKADSPPATYGAKHSKENPISEFVSIIKGDLPGIPLLFEPGENFAYGWSSDILGFVIEKASGQTLEDYLQQYIFKPLGMTASFYLTPDIKARLVDLTYKRDGKLEVWDNQSVLMEQDPTKITRHMGGIGLYASLKGYLGLLRHLLQINAGKATNPIISTDSVHSLFEPALNEDGGKSLSDFFAMHDPFTPVGSKLQWSTALGICASDWPERRNKGTAFWGGWAHTFHSMDPTTGVAAVFGTQLTPVGDQEVCRVYSEFETVLFASLSK